MKRFDRLPPDGVSCHEAGSMDPCRGGNASWMIKMTDESKFLFVKSAVKEVIKTQNCKTSKELLEDNALNEMIRSILVKACQRARENGRTIVFPRDI